ncbi:Ig-like domain-containing protein, partial [Microcoleus sp. MOSTC5]|uniref:Ig-like domain-containing protein n=1 Tax=Microcoleus sp. MOSTC5 TaxID=3055378 RepID=UPI0040408387
MLNGLPGVLSNDTDANSDPLTAALVTGPSNGTISFNALGDFVYTPKAGFVGTDTFTYSVSDGTDSSVQPATVTINVTNNPPKVNPDTYTVLHDKVLNGIPGVLINDTDADLDMLIPALVTGPSNGTISFNALGDFVYTPNPGFVGNDTFTYSVSDRAATVPGTVNINVTNNPPKVNPDTYTVLHDKVLNGIPGVLINDTDADLDMLIPALVTGPSNGTISFNA